MLDEVLFMQIRLFRMFREATGLTTPECRKIFSDGKVWDFIERCYDSLHLSSDDLALQDVFNRLKAQGVSWQS